MTPPLPRIEPVFRFRQGSHASQTKGPASEETGPAIGWRKRLALIAAHILMARPAVLLLRLAVRLHGIAALLRLALMLPGLAALLLLASMAGLAALLLLHLTVLVASVALLCHVLAPLHPCRN